MARPSDWETEPMPERRAKIPLNRTFTVEQVAAIRRGLYPEQMEDKWFIYWADDRLFFHRSWTGFCVYIARFERQDQKWRMVEAHVNREPEQYRGTSDERDAQMISYLIDVLLLNRPAPFPADPTLSPQEQMLQQWGEVGRGMLDEEDEDE